MQNSWRIQHDRGHGAGAYTWYFPDGDRPPVDNGPAEAHESLMILNTSQHPANIELDLYWTDKEPTLGIKVRVEAERVRCLRVPCRIGVAAGLAKVQAIEGALRGGFINVLVTDSMVAQALCNSSSTGSFPPPNDQHMEERTPP